MTLREAHKTAMDVLNKTEEGLKKDREQEARKRLEASPLLEFMLERARKDEEIVRNILDTAFYNG